MGWCSCSIRPSWPAPTFPIVQQERTWARHSGSAFGISQLWGENPQIYGQFSYDGVPLRDTTASIF